MDQDWYAITLDRKVHFEGSTPLLTQADSNSCTNRFSGHNSSNSESYVWLTHHRILDNTG